MRTACDPSLERRGRILSVNHGTRGHPQEIHHAPVRKLRGHVVLVLREAAAVSVGVKAIQEERPVVIGDGRAQWKQGNVKIVTGEASEGHAADDFSPVPRRGEVGRQLGEERFGARLRPAPG